MEERDVTPDSGTDSRGAARLREPIGDLAGPAVVIGEAATWVGPHRPPAGARGLVAGVTTTGESRRRDFALFGAGATSEVLPRWRSLTKLPGIRTVVHARQVHGSTVLVHREDPPGVRITDDADGHVTRTPGTLLTVATADCVPVFLVDRTFGGLALLHAGWRGAADGILQRGIARLRESFGAAPADLRIHLGPAICGECYEVGPEVFEAFDEPVPSRPSPIDVRAILVRRALAEGVPLDFITVSEHCTRCGDGRFFSHRGGDAGRQIAVLGWRDLDAESIE